MITNNEKDVSSIPEIISFIKQKDYTFIKKLGNGSFGITILLKDETIDEHFVCKKYLPQEGINIKKYFKNFLNEIKLMYKLNHNNIVRIFSYHMYEEIHTGFVLMEHIDGMNIETFIKDNPEMINDVFEQVIEGFSYLESKKILHRDIRPTNMLVDKNGFVKIIDFGFSKQIFIKEDYDRSFSSLNWWCQLPQDFQKHIYDFKTEIYFVGKLFEKLIIQNDISGFDYNSILAEMCVSEPNHRVTSFDCIKRKLQNNETMDELFTPEEKTTYQDFADELSLIISGVYDETKYCDDIELLQKELSDLYKSVMLEDFVPQNTSIIRYFLNGAYRYKTNKHLSTYTLKCFLNFLKGCSKDKRNIVLSNLHSRLDGLHRIEKETEILDEDIPF